MTLRPAASSLALLATLLVTSLAFVGEAAAQDRRVRIINETSVDMLYFYASRASTTSWEEDILGEDILSSGSSVVIDIDDGTGACLFDFKAVFADGDELTDNDINVCEIGSYRYHD